jgi:hypothetical protein
MQANQANKRSDKQVQSVRQAKQQAIKKVRLASKLNFTYQLKLGSKIPVLASLPEVGQAYDNSHPPANSRTIDLAI